MLALSGLREGFARGWISPQTPPLLAPKPSWVKSSVCISSTLIESKALHLHYFSHLRKTGGRGSYRLVHTAWILARNYRKRRHQTAYHRARYQYPRRSSLHCSKWKKRP